MFSSVFDKVVSRTAPKILQTFPAREALPVDPSTLCCLAFADHFLSNYPISRDTVRASIPEKGELSAGIALSPNDIETVMKGSAILAGRLATALKRKTRSTDGSVLTCCPAELLAKVKGMYGDRLTCIGREIRILRDLRAEQEETMLLRQMHTLKNAAVGADSGAREKWCLVVGSGGESLTICGIPLSQAEGSIGGCDFLVFDPSPRPLMNLQGSYVIRFTTVRGLQLHLISALGQVWRTEGKGSNPAKRNGSDYINISVVMSSLPSDSKPDQLQGRHVMDVNVAQLRKSEKAEAIRKKKEEVEAIRKAMKPRERVGGIDKPKNTKNLEDTQVMQTRHSVTCPPDSGRRAQCCKNVEAVQSPSVMDSYQDAGVCKGEEVGGSAIVGVVDSHSTNTPSSVVGGALNGWEMEVSSESAAGLGHIALKSSQLEDQSSENLGENKAEDRKVQYKSELCSSGGNTDRYSLCAASQNAFVKAAISVPSEESGKQEQKYADPVNRNLGLEGILGRGPELACAAMSDSVEEEREGSLLDGALLHSVEGEGLAEYGLRAYGVYRNHAIILGGIETSGMEMEDEGVLGSFKDDSRPWTANALPPPCAFDTQSSTQRECLVKDYHLRGKDEVTTSSCVVEDIGKVGGQEEQDTDVFPGRGEFYTEVGLSSRVAKKAEGARSRLFGEHQGEVNGGRGARYSDGCSGNKSDSELGTPVDFMQGRGEEADTGQNIYSGKMAEHHLHVEPHPPPLHRSSSPPSAAHSLGDAMIRPRRRWTQGVPDLARVETHHEKQKQLRNDILDDPLPPPPPFMIPESSDWTQKNGTAGEKIEALSHRKHRSASSLTCNEMGMHVETPVERGKAGTNERRMEEPVKVRVSESRGGSILTYDACSDGRSTGGRAISYSATVTRDGFPLRTSSEDGLLSSSTDVTPSTTGESLEDVYNGLVEGCPWNKVGETLEASLRPSSLVENRGGVSRLDSEPQLKETTSAGGPWDEYQVGSQQDNGGLGEGEGEGCNESGTDDRFHPCGLMSEVASGEVLEAFCIDTKQINVGSQQSGEKSSRDASGETNGTDSNGSTSTASLPGPRCDTLRHVNVVGAQKRQPQRRGNNTCLDQGGNSRDVSLSPSAASMSNSKVFQKSQTCDVVESPHSLGTMNVCEGSKMLSRGISPISAERTNHAEFLWFGEPHTDKEPNLPSDPTLDAFCDGGFGSGEKLEEEFVGTGLEDGQGKTYEVTKESLLLQMEVQQQREIVQRRQRAELEQARDRRIHVGVELLRRLDMLRPSLPAATQSLLLQDQQQQYIQAMVKPDELPPCDPSSVNGVTPGVELELGGKSRTTGAADRRVLPQQPVGAGILSHRGITPCLALSPNKVMADISQSPAISFASDFESVNNDTSPQVSLAGCSGRRPAGVGANPWVGEVDIEVGEGKVGSMERGRGRSASVVSDRADPGVRDATPPPVCFNISMGSSVDGCGREDKTQHFEALRAKKLGELEERHRIQKKRNGTTKSASQQNKEVEGQKDSAHEITQQDLSRSKRQTPSTFECSNLVEFDERGLVDTPNKANRMGKPGFDSERYRGGWRAQSNAASLPVRGLSRLSNRKMVRNAVNLLCLAGTHLEEKKARALEVLDAHPGSNFVLLLAHTKLLTFKGLYVYMEGEKRAEKIFGLGPSILDASMASGFYKYNSAAREFREVHSRSLGLTTDAVSIEAGKLRRPRVAALPTP